MWWITVATLVQLFIIPLYKISLFRHWSTHNMLSALRVMEWKNSLTLSNLQLKLWWNTSLCDEILKDSAKRVKDVEERANDFHRKRWLYFFIVYRDIFWEKKIFIFIVKCLQKLMLSGNANNLLQNNISQLILILHRYSSWSLNFQFHV